MKDRGGSLVHHTRGKCNSGRNSQFFSTIKVRVQGTRIRGGQSEAGVRCRVKVENIKIKHNNK